MNLGRAALLVINVVAIALLAPALIVAPTLIADYPVTPFHWGALAIGYTSSAGLLRLSLRRETCAVLEDGRHIADAKMLAIITHLEAGAAAPPPDRAAQVGGYSADDAPPR
jgi:hypothetical protein